ncbi:LytR/AlgR family response regulator transcription factor [Bifidobacterium bombi]|uniref:Two-component response regulator VirR n=1 Tax=Bifidobacterium bombi DSM 19703 TaxID=1341695 RepID=A0A080N3T7_9BIFI|nr:LytTR family DNA-binding domain-containing protein [Bifidobacterium bombi]KFF30800.1 two-component response regulator VirR [Bifidobacterium bombi DSM 19703]
MGALRIAVVEDDPGACTLILDYLQRYQSENGQDFMISAFNDGEKIADNYHSEYDIILMDIEMKHMDGMEAARRIRTVDKSVVIVFITAASQYAINGYEVQALSYLLKPVPYFAFSQEMARSIEQARSNENRSILLETGTRQIRLELRDILYIESIRHTIIIHTNGGKVSITSTLKKLEAQLAEHGFFRSNSCYLVNLQHVAGIDGQDCVMSNGERLRISRPRKKAFTTALSDYINGSAL